MGCAEQTKKRCMLNSLYGITRRYLASLSPVWNPVNCEDLTTFSRWSPMTHILIPYSYKVQNFGPSFKTFLKVIMVSNAFIFPSYFDTPFATDIPCSKYDSKGRQLSFVETEVQRLERMALVNSKLRRSSPKARSRQPSFLNPVSPCSHLYIHRLTYSYKSSNVNPSPEMLDPSGNFFLVPTSCESSPSSSTTSHKRRSLSSIPEED
jgi:hypothetical protein